MGAAPYPGQASENCKWMQVETSGNIFLKSTCWLSSFPLKVFGEPSMAMILGVRWTQDTRLLRGRLLGGESKGLGDYQQIFPELGEWGPCPLSSPRRLSGCLGMLGGHHWRQRWPLGLLDPFCPAKWEGVLDCQWNELKTVAETKKISRVSALCICHDICKFCEWA